jgi:hypothetical protein
MAPARPPVRRSKANYEAAVKTRPELSQTQWKEVDINDPASVQVGLPPKQTRGAF